MTERLDIARAFVVAVILASAATACHKRDVPVPTLATAPTPAAMVTFRLSGTITRPDGRPIAGASVRFFLGPNPFLRTTDDIGRFSFDSVATLPSQTVGLLAFAFGYESASQTTVASGENLTVSLALAPIPQLVLNGTLSSATSLDSAWIGEAYDSEYVKSVRQFAFVAPPAQSLDVDLAFASTPGAALRIWIANTATQSDGNGSHQRLTIPPATVGVLIVGEPGTAPDLAAPVPFTLTTSAPGVAEAMPAPAVMIGSLSAGPAGVSGNTYVYYPNFVVQETSGTGPVTITSIEYTQDTSQAVDVMASTCLPDRLVPSGGTWTMAGIGTTCREIRTSRPIASLTVTVRYADTAARSGVAVAQVAAPTAVAARGPR